MQPEQMKQNLEKFEQLADEMVRAAKSASAVPDDLRRSVDTLHQKARDAKGQPMMNDAQYRDCVLELEQLADQAMAASRQASGLDAQLQDAVKRGHGELSREKHALGATA